jgi:hypothetical protein
MQSSQILPVIPLRNAVLLPGVSFPIAVGRPGTLHARIDDTAFERDLHIHVPAGAIPKDGLEIVPVQDLTEALAVSLRGHVRDGQLPFSHEALGAVKETPVAH